MYGWGVVLRVLPTRYLGEGDFMLGTIFSPVERLAHGWQVLASLLLTGAVTALCYALSQAGLAELAGTAMSFYAVFVGTRVFAKVAASRPGGHFGATKNLLRQAQADFRTWMTDRTLLALFVLGVPATVSYVALRSACIALLAVFGNLWFAVAFGLLFGALVASPVLFRDLGRLVTRDSGTAPPEAPVSASERSVGRAAPSASSGVPQAPVEPPTCVSEPDGTVSPPA